MKQSEQCFRLQFRFYAVDTQVCKKVPCLDRLTYVQFARALKKSLQDMQSLQHTPL